MQYCIRKKDYYRFCIHPDSIITWLFLFIILPGVDVDLIQIFRLSCSPIANPFQGNRKCIPFTCSFLWSSRFPVHSLSLNSLWDTFGLGLQEWLEDSLAFDKRHIISSVPGVFKSYISPGQLDYCPVFCPWLEVTGLRKKRNHILSISAANI